MSQKIITKPPTPEYEASYERVFGKKICKISMQELENGAEILPKLKECGFNFEKQISRRNDDVSCFVVFWQ